MRNAPLPLNLRLDPKGDTSRLATQLSDILSRTHQEVNRLSVKADSFPDVKNDYAADSTGGRDSTSAFNAFSAAIRAALVDADYDYMPLKYTVPPGVYLLDSWNLTNIKARRIQIHGHGVVLVARTASKHVIDMLGSRFVSLHGFVIYSGSGVVAKSAIQLGNIGTETCGNNALYDVMGIGYYSHAALMNLGSETTTYWGSTFLNRNTDSAAYAAVFDGQAVSTWLPTSDYATVTKTAGDAVSFTNNKAYGCQFRNEGGGSACWGAKMEDFTFDRACYFLSFNASAWVIYAASALRSKDLSINGQFENSQNDNPTAGNIGIRYAFTFDNDGSNTAIDGFTCEAFGPQCETYFMRNIGAGSIRISDANLRVHSLAQAAAVFFNGTMSLDGHIETQNASKLNLGALTAFNGTIHCDDFTALASVPAAGTYTIHSRSNSKAYVGGQYLPAAAALTFTPTVTFATPGDLSVSYATRVANYVPLAGGAAHITVELTFTPTYTTASGEFRISGLPLATPVGANDAHFIVGSINSAFTFPASVTQVTARLPGNSTNFRLYGSGSGIASTVFTTAHVPTGTAKTLSFSGVYIPA